MIKQLKPFAYVSLVLLFMSMIQGIVEQRMLQAVSSALAYVTLGLMTTHLGDKNE